MLSRNLIVGLISIASFWSASAQADLNCTLRTVYNANIFGEALGAANPRLAVATDSTGITVLIGSKVWATESGSQIDQYSWGAYRITLRHPGVFAAASVLEVVPPITQGQFQNPYAEMYKRDGKFGVKIADFECR
jgi:hypothetical protein